MLRWGCLISHLPPKALCQFLRCRLSLDLDGTVTGQDLAWWWQLAQRQDLSQELALVALPVHRTRTRKRVTRPQLGATVGPRATRAATETKSRHAYGTVPGTLFRTEILKKS